MPRSRYSNPEMWQKAADQAIRVAAKTFVACAATNVTNLTDTGWFGALNVSAAAALISLVASIAEAPEVPPMLDDAH